MVTGTALVLGVLAGCGEQVSPAGSEGGATSTGVSAGTSAKAPPTASDVATPQPPAGKPQNPSGGEPPVSIGPNGPVVPAGVTEVPAKQVDASALPAFFEYGNKVWVYDGGFALQLFAAASSSCTDAEAVVVDQSADSVKIMVRPLAQPQGGRPDDGACAMVMTPKPVTVTLDSPLQNRKVLLTAGR